MHQVHYNGNRAPFGIYISSWLNQNPSRVSLLNQFLQEILGMNNVWLVSGTDITNFYHHPSTHADLMLKNSTFDCQAQAISDELPQPGENATTTGANATLVQSSGNVIALGILPVLFGLLVVRANHEQ